LLDLALRVNLPVKTRTGAVGRDNEGVSAIRLLDLPVRDHPEAEAINLNVFENRESVVDGSTFRSSQEGWQIGVCRRGVGV
jgi:hypothetical protein